MTAKDQIASAIAAHQEWKARLIHAIQQGSSDYQPTIVEKDDQCALGHWLCDCDPELLQSIHYQTVRQLHADFHREAARILELALNGQRGQACLALGLGSQYVKISSALVLEMRKWERDL